MITMRFVLVLFLLFPFTLHAVESNGPITAPSYILIEKDSLEIIAGRDYYKRLAPASTTKVLTTLIALEKLEGNEPITPDRAVLKIPRSKMNLVPGKQYKSWDLMKGAMVESANDAAYSLATYVGGTEQRFAVMMNERAAQLGATDTHFENASGLPAVDQYTTCYDLALIFKEALLDKRFMELITTRYFLFQDTPRRVEYKNHNRLLFCFEPTIGGKTGYTRSSKHSYVGAFEKDGRVYILALLGSRNLWGDSVEILKNLYTVLPTDRELRLARAGSPSLASYRPKRGPKIPAIKKIRAKKTRKANRI
ncbi:MAG TPA: serine hydrolase [Syntrophorhabdaceae bacterium]|nr:serine hydrolase [Syntrophorhabdaceae bacterium]